MWLMMDVNELLTSLNASTSRNSRKQLWMLFSLSSGSDYHGCRFQAVSFRFERDLARLTLWTDDYQATALVSLAKRRTEAGCVIRCGTAGGSKLARAGDGEMNGEHSRGNHDSVLVDYLDCDIRKIIAIGANHGAVGRKPDFLRFACGAKAGAGDGFAAD